VTASVINDLNGARLALVSTASGESGDLSVTGNTTGLIFTKSAAGVNASFSIDGVPLNSTTNTVSGALAAVTLNLVSPAPGIPVLLTVGADRATQAVNAFVASYNTVMGAINSQFTFDPIANTDGPLAANSSLRSLQGRLLSDVTFSRTGNNGYVILASLGVNMANDGTLSVDSVELNEVISDLLRASLIEAQINASKTILETQITNLLSLREAWIEVERTSRASAHPPVPAQGVAAAEASSGDRAPSNWKA
jgi:flagellar hook-associated protein 2